MATERQRRLAEALAKNLYAMPPLSAKELLESVGYAGTTALAEAGRTINSAGVLEELGKLGFTIENAKGVVSQIMLDEDVDAQARLKAADMTFKVHGAYAPEKKDITTGGQQLTNLTPEQIAKINEVALNE